jgi:surface protein
MFRGASNFNQDISYWNVSSATNMGRMFFDSSFNQNINGWDISNVENMVMMFRNTPFNQPLDNWNVSNVSNMTRVFQYSAFNQDISNWCVSLISSEPAGFSLGSPLTNPHKPVWGTCVVNLNKNITHADMYDTRVYPNPYNASKNKYMTIQWKGEAVIDQVKLVDVNGRIIKVMLNQNRDNNANFEMPYNVSEGVYVLMISSGDNHIYKRISIEH